MFKKALLTLFILLSFCAVSVQAQTLPKVIAYYPDWAYPSIPPSKIDFTVVDIVINFTANPSLTAPYYSPMKNAAEEAAVIAAAHAAGKKAILCLGGVYGQGASDFNTVIADPVKMMAFVKAACDDIVVKNYDGADVDLENPNNSTSYKNYIAAVKAELAKTGRILTESVDKGMSGSSTPIMQNAATVNANVDYLNVMQYDYGISQYAGHNAPLKPGDCSLAGGNWTAWSIADHGTQNFVAGGISSNIMAYAIPFYTWEMHGIDGPCQLTPNSKNYGTYATILKDKAQYPNSYRWDNNAKVPYLSFTDASGVKHFKSYEDSVSIYWKCVDAKSKNIKAIMIYELWSGWVSTNPVGKQDVLLQYLKANMQKVWGTTTPPPTVTLTSNTIVASAAVDSIGKQMSFTATTNVKADSIRWFRHLAGTPTGLYVVTGFPTQLTHQMFWTPTTAGIWESYCVAYLGTTTLESNRINVSVPAAATPPPATVASASISGPTTATTGKPVTIIGTAANVVNFDLYVDGAFKERKTAAPFTFTWLAAPAGTHKINGFAQATAGAGSAWITLNDVNITVKDSTVVIPPAPKIYSQAELDSAKAVSFAAGKASVVCPTCPPPVVCPPPVDTTGTAAKYYNIFFPQGWNAALTATQDSARGTIQVVLPVIKPPKK